MMIIFNWKNGKIHLKCVKDLFKKNSLFIPLYLAKVPIGYGYWSGSDQKVSDPQPCINRSSHKISFYVPVPRSGTRYRTYSVSLFTVPGRGRGYWLKSGISSNYVPVPYLPTYSLFSVNITRHFAGTYKCKADNGYSPDGSMAEVRLTVEHK